MRTAFVKLVCMGILVVASLTECSAPLSQPEVRQAPALDPLISPPPSLLVANPR